MLAQTLVIFLVYVTKGNTNLINNSNILLDILLILLAGSIGLMATSLETTPTAPMGRRICSYTFHKYSIQSQKLTSYHDIISYHGKYNEHLLNTDTTSMKSIQNSRCQK